MSTILVVAGGDHVDPSLIEELPAPDHVIAADSGLVNAQLLGFEADVVVGDLDSLPDEKIPEHTEVIRHPNEKDATDLELAFELALRYQPRRIVLVGAEGGRFDHELGAVAVICSDRWAAVPEIDWVRHNATCSVVRRIRRLQGDPGGLVGLLAAGGDALGVTTKGLKWSLSDETLHHGSSRGLSNEIVQPEFSVTVREGTVLAVLINGA